MNKATSRHVGLNLGASHAQAHASAESPLFGFWVFLMSDAVIFTLLFAIYVSMRHATAGGPEPHEIFTLRSTFVETLVLLLSSFSFGMASLSMKYHTANKTRLLGWLLLTLLLGLAFLGLELHDFYTMAALGAVPQRSGFLSAFFALVPTHGIHVASACVWLIVMMIQIVVFGINSAVMTRIMRLAVFWHFLDIIWIGIFSVVYLQGLIT